MNWIECEKDDDCEMPEGELHGPGTVSVWIRTNNPYADRYGVGSYDYEQAGWSYDGCAPGFEVTHWAVIEPPEGLRW